MIIVFALLLGLWRMWLGRGVDGWPVFLRRTDGRAFPGATYLQYALLVGFLFAFFDWQIALTNAVAILLLARGSGHTPLLYGPGLLPETASLKGLEGALYAFSKEVDNPELRWWVFADLRYILPSLLWGVALSAQIGPRGFAVTAAALAMVAIYRLRAALGVEVKYAELVGWAAYGAALAI